MGYSDDLDIDEFALDREWIKQPSLFMQYAEKSAKADLIKKKAKERVEIVKAETDSSIRGEASAAGEKITEKVVESRIIMDSDYQAALDELATAEFNYNIMSSAVRAFDQRKSALENLVRLHLGGYFAAPKQDRMQDEEKQPTITERTSQGQKERLNRRNREKKG